MTDPKQAEKPVPVKEPWRPGALLLAGIALSALAVWCAYDLVTQASEKTWPADATWILFNWIGAVAATAGAAWSFILAGVRARAKSANAG